MPKQKRTNKSKDEILYDIRQKEQIERDETKRKDKVDREKALCKLIWPFIETQDTIYDAQTVLNALSGYITFSLTKKYEDIKVSNLDLDFTKEPESKLKTAIVSLAGLVALEGAKDSASLLERFGKTLAQYGSSQYLKKPMATLKMKDIIA